MKFKLRKFRDMPWDIRVQIVVVGSFLIATFISWVAINVVYS